MTFIDALLSNFDPTKEEPLIDVVCTRQAVIENLDQMRKHVEDSADDKTVFTMKLSTKDGRSTFKLEFSAYNEVRKTIHFTEPVSQDQVRRAFGG